MTVLENLLVAQHNALMRLRLHLPRHLFGCCRFTAGGERGGRQGARYWLEKIGLLERADDPAGDLPYGDQRRLEIARAMCTGPVLLCLDEPAAGPQPARVARAERLLLVIRDEHGDLDPADRARHERGDGDLRPRRRARLRRQKIADGTPEFVRNDPR
jgi:branched-chain amino acid transport system ATP-binding protein